MKYLILAKTSCGEPWDGKPRFIVCEDIESQIADWYLGHEHLPIITAFPGMKEFGECRVRDKDNIVAYLCWCPILDTQRYCLAEVLYGRVTAMHKLDYAIAYMNVIFADYNKHKNTEYLSESACFIEVRFRNSQPAEKWAIFDFIKGEYVERW